MSVVQSPNRVLDTVTLLNCGGTINMSGARSARPDDMVARKLAPALSAASAETCARPCDLAATADTPLLPFVP